MGKVSVILPAAGEGRRFGADTNKIFQPLAGRAIVLHTLERFARRRDVAEILLVLSARDLEPAREHLGRHLDAWGVRLAEGGATRAESVRSALSLAREDVELVCVHDAVRPCIDAELIDEVFREARRTGAAILAAPVHGTLKKVSPQGLIEWTVPRESLWQAQTPQVFHPDLLRRAYASNVRGVTDDAQLVEALGHPVSVVQGDPRNLKITTPADLALAEAILQASDS